jgi:hypothetical protein
MGYFAQLRARQPPDKLYHYTSVEGVAGILRTKAVRATVVHYLNDAQEFRHAFGVARGVMADKLTISSNNDLASLFAHLSNSLERIEHIRIAVFSLTEEGDLLSQWRGYCEPGGGYSLGFSPAFLRPFLNDHGFFLAPCIYDDTGHRALVEEVVDNVSLAFRQVRQDSGAPFEELKDKMLPGFFALFSRIAPMIKHRSFAEEREWRIVSGLIADDSPHLGHRLGRSMLIPYFELPLQANASRFRVEEIVVGPTQHQYIAMNSLTSLLSREGVQWQAVRPSHIPFRQL